VAPVRFTVSRDTASSAVYVDPDFCDRIEMRVVVREAAATQPTFAGVGFSSSRGDSFTAKDALQEVGRTTLANHEAAIVYRFSGISTCISSAHNSTSAEYCGAVTRSACRLSPSISIPNHVRLALPSLLTA